MKQIILDYEEYKELEKCKQVLDNISNYYRYGKKEDENNKITLIIEDKELFEYLYEKSKWRI